MTTVQIRTTAEEDAMLYALKDKAGSRANSKVFRWALKKCYELFK